LDFLGGLIPAVATVLNTDRVDLLTLVPPRTLSAFRHLAHNQSLAYLQLRHVSSSSRAGWNRQKRCTCGPRKVLRRCWAAITRMWPQR